MVEIYFVVCLAFLSKIRLLGPAVSRYNSLVSTLHTAHTTPLTHSLPYHNNLAHVSIQDLKKIPPYLG